MHVKGKGPGAYTARGFLGLAWIDSGGVDGTRTRDPRRDRPVFQPTELPLLAGSLSLASCDTSQALRLGDPTGIRTPVLTVTGRCPRPLDDGGKTLERTDDKRRRTIDRFWWR